MSHRYGMVSGSGNHAKCLVTEKNPLRANDRHGVRFGRFLTIDNRSASKRCK